MHGNVWEWCQDRYGLYLSGPQTDPLGPASGDDRVVRGGCWDYIPRFLPIGNSLWVLDLPGLDGGGPAAREDGSVQP